MNYLIKHTLLMLFVCLFLTATSFKSTAAKSTNIDDEAPSTPTQLVQTDSTTQSVTISWAHSSDNVGILGYKIFLNQQYQFFVSDNQCTIDALDAGMSYSVQIIAVDSFENRSDYSDALIVYTQQPEHVLITFNVTDNSGPLANAEVYCYGESAVTDANGNAVFDHITAGTFIHYNIWKEGYQSFYDDREVTENTTIDVYLNNTQYNATFHVSDANGPIANAQVYMHGKFENTNAEGVVTLGGYFPNEEMYYSVNKEGYELFNGTLTLTSDTNIYIELIPYNYLVTFYVHHNGIALENAQVYFNNQWRYTSHNGTITFDGVLFGDDQRYEVSSTGYKSKEGNINVDQDKEISVNLEEDAQKVTFYVTDQYQHALDSANIYFFGKELYTDSNGKAIYENIPADIHYFLAEYKGINEVDGTVNVVNDTTVYITIEIQYLTVQFMILDPREEPIIQAKVAFNGEYAFTNENGVVVFDQVMPGRAQEFTITHPDYHTIESEVDVYEDKELTLMMQSLTEVVEFRVYSNDEALEGAKVFFNNEYVYTNHDGVALFDGVSAGEGQEYWVEKDGYLKYEANVDVGGYEIVNVHMDKEPSYYWVKFYVYDGEHPLQNAAVRFNNEVIYTDENGLAKFHEVLEGEDQLYHVNKEGYAPVEANINVWENKIQKIYLQSYSFTVEFIIKQGDIKIEGAEVQFNDEIVLSDKNGLARFDHVYPGEALPFEINKNGYSTIVDEIDVFEDKEIQIQIQPNLHTVTFYVFDEEENPITNAKVHLNNDYSYTDEYGRTIFDGVSGLSESLYWVTKDGYHGTEANCTITNDTTIQVLLKEETNTVKFVVKHNGTYLSGAKVSFNGEEQITDYRGKVYFNNVSSGEGLSYEVSTEGFEPYQGTVNVNGYTIEYVELELTTYVIGFVVANGDLPVTGAKVYMNGEHAYTDEQGYVVFDNVPEEIQMAYLVQKEGFNDLEGHFDVKKDTTIYIQLQRNQFNVTFLVYDNEEQPISEAKVHLNNQHAYTNENGMVVFDGITYEWEHAYWIKKDGYHDVEANFNINGDTTIQVLLQPETYTIEFVVKHNGQFMQGAKVTFNHQEFITDQYGKAYFDGVEKGENQPYTVQLNGFEPIESTVNVVGNTVEHVELDITTHVIGFAVANGDLPVAGAKVYMNGEHAYTDEQGYVVFDNVPEEIQMAYLVIKEGFNDLEGHFDVKKDTTIHVQLLRNQFNVTFLVYNNEEQPISEAKVHLNNQHAYTNENGMVVFDGITYEWEHAYWIKKDGYHDVEANFNINGDTTIQVLLQPETYTIEFVVKHNGQFMQGAKITFNHQEFIADRNGKAYFDGVEKGENQPYMVQLDGFDPIESTVNVKGNTVEKVELELTTHVIGFVVANGDLPVTGAKVYMKDEHAYTDEQGYVVFDNVPEEIQMAFMVKKEGFYELESHFDVKGDTTIHVQLHRNKFNITFMVYNELQELVEGAQIHLTSTPVFTDSKGSVTYTDIPADIFDWWVKMEGYQKIEGEINVSKDDTIIVQLSPSYYTVSFLILNEQEEPIIDAAIHFNDQLVLTNSTGLAVFDSIRSNQKIAYTITKNGFRSKDGQINISEDKQLTIMLEPKYYWAGFKVYANNKPMQNTLISLENQVQETNPNGFVKFTELHYGDTLHYMVTKENFDTIKGSIIINKNQEIRIDLIETTYLVAFNVTDGENPIKNASVFFEDEMQMTNADGTALFDGILPGSQLYYLVEKGGYDVFQGTTDVIGDNKVNITLSQHTYVVTFNVSSDDVPLEGAMVMFSHEKVETDSTGVAIIDGILPGENKEYHIIKDGYATSTGTLNIEKDKVVFIDMKDDGSGITFVINDGYSPVANADVIINEKVAKTDAYGVAKFDQLTDKSSIIYKVIHSDFHTTNGVIDIVTDYVVEEVVMEHVTNNYNLDLFEAKVYPNPAQDAIVLNSNHSVERIRFVTQQGIVKKQFTELNMGQTALDISDLPSGFYLVQIISKNNQKKTERILVL